MATYAICGSGTLLVPQSYALRPARVPAAKLLVAMVE
jgi:hypothetical protein